MLTQSSSYHKDLGNGLILRSIANQRDVDRVATFHSAIHGPAVADMVRQLVLSHPHTRPEHWLYVEDATSAQVVSALCLIPWRLRFQEAELTAGEMGIVATHPGYRRRGLIRAQAVRHQELLAEGEFDLSHIQGIPYFYRQFGYDYALPLEGGWQVDLHAVPDKRDVATYALRPATVDDLPALMTMYESASQDLQIYTRRDRDEWLYLLGPSMQTEMAADTYLVLDTDQCEVAYLRVPHHGFGEGLIVNEVSRMSVDVAKAVIRLVRDLAVTQSKPYIRLCLPNNCEIVRAARYLDAHDLGHYAWQIKVMDRARLLRKLGPVFERRLATSSLSGLTQDVCLNLYREAYECRFREGMLASVESLGPVERDGIRIPPRLFAPLLFGYRTREELAAAHHDFSVSRDWRQLVDVLFCRSTSFLYTIY